MHNNVGLNIGGAGVAGHNSNNNGMLTNGNNSVPLYRRQAHTGNGIGGGNGGYNNMHGMDAGANLIEALFQANNSVVDHSVKSSDHMHGLLYNNFNGLKGGGHELDLFQAMAPSVPHSEAANHHQQSSGSSATTYAAVLSQGPQAVVGGGVGTGPSPGQSQAQAGVAGSGTGGKVAPAVGGNDLLEKDPFAAIRELGQATTGFYNYFQWGTVTAAAHLQLWHQRVI